MKKLSAILSIAIILVSAIAFLWIPASASTVMHTASVSPTVTTVPKVKYVFNVTNLSNATEKITEVKITFPSGFTKVEANAAGWTGTDWPTIIFINNTPADAIAPNSYKLFNVTVNWPAVPPSTVTFSVNCTASGKPSINNPVNIKVSFNPKFKATIDKTHVKGSTSYLFNITTVNVASDIGLGTINITYPSGWTFNALVGYGGSRPWPTIVHDASRNTFKLTGPNLLIGEYVWIQVNMTTTSTTREPDHWNSTAWDTGGTLLGTYDLPVIVDAVKPTVKITKPNVSYYSIGFKNRIWINATVKDDLNITKYGITVRINDTARFEYVTHVKTDDFNYTYCFANKTAISDGPLAVKVTAMDKAGNVGFDEKSTTVDNTAPKQVWVKVLDQYGELQFVDGIYWMGKDTKYIKVNASFYNPATPISGYIYLNTTRYSFTNKTNTPDFNVTGSDYVILKITLIDGASPKPNNFTQTWEIKRDKIPPSKVTYTSIETICGGVIIRNVAANDTVGILLYQVYVNGTLWTATIPKKDLEATTPKSNAGWYAFSGVLVLNLTEKFAGKVANITIRAVDFGANEGPWSTPALLTIPEGEWYPVKLHKGWNLISLPLISANSSRTAVLSLILKQGMAGVTVVYEYDQYTDTWILNPTKMTDGKGYWVYMKDNDVLVVSGSKMPPPGGIPPTYTLTKGWVLAGFKSTVNMTVAEYLASVRNASYFRILFVWDAVKQKWDILDREKAGAQLAPGQGFWIYMYEEEVLIPPKP